METLGCLLISMIRMRLLGMVFRYNAAAIYRKSGRSIPIFGYFTQAKIINGRYEPILGVWNVASMLA
jgi:hypothetical protein